VSALLVQVFDGTVLVSAEADFRQNDGVPLPNGAPSHFSGLGKRGDETEIRVRSAGRLAASGHSEALPLATALPPPTRSTPFRMGSPALMTVDVSSRAHALLDQLPTIQSRALAASPREKISTISIYNNRAGGDPRARRCVSGVLNSANEWDGYGGGDPARLVRILCCHMGGDDGGDDVASRGSGGLETRE
jgi:hypothetical protein